MIISNHQSNIDAGLLGASINRDLKFPAKIELFKNPFMSFFLKSYGCQMNIYDSEKITSILEKKVSYNAIDDFFFALVKPK